jgi:hypothetical protein
MIIITKSIKILNKRNNIIEYKKFLFIYDNMKIFGKHMLYESR